MADSGWRAGRRVRGSGGVEIATWDLGGVGPPLLLVHATGFHARMWLPMAPVLRPQHRVIAVDLRGHGASGHAPDGSYRDWSVFADDLLAVVDSLDLAGSPGGLYAAGHSIGGAVLLLAAQRRPRLLRALYCYEPIVLSPVERAASRDGPVPLAALAAKRRGSFPSRQAARDNYAAKPPFSAFEPSALDAYVDHAFVDSADGTVALACRPEEEASVYVGAAEHDAWDHLPATATRVVVAGGGESGPAPPVEPIAARLPDASVERLSGLTHFGPMEDPGRVAAAIATALAGPGGPTGRSQRVVSL